MKYIFHEIYDYVSPEVQHEEDGRNRDDNLEGHPLPHEVGDQRKDRRTDAERELRQDAEPRPVLGSAYLRHFKEGNMFEIIFVITAFLMDTRS